MKIKMLLVFCFRGCCFILVGMGVIVFIVDGFNINFDFVIVLV